VPEPLDLTAASCKNLSASELSVCHPLTVASAELLRSFLSELLPRRSLRLHSTSFLLEFWQCRGRSSRRAIICGHAGGLVCALVMTAGKYWD